MIRAVDKSEASSRWGHGKEAPFARQVEVEPPVRP